MIKLEVKKLDARLAKEKRAIIMSELKKGFNPKEVAQLLRLTTCDYIYQVIRESAIQEMVEQDEDKYSRDKEIVTGK